MSSWQYVETHDYIETSKELELSEEIREAIKRWATSAGRVPTNKQRLCHRTPRNKFELWNARIPNPDANRGASGGFRLTYFFNLIDESIYLGRIEKRSDLGGRNEHPRDQRKYDAYINALSDYLLRTENELLSTS